MQTQNRDVELVLHLASLKSVESEVEEYRTYLHL